MPYGSYTVRVNNESAAAAKILPNLGVHLEVADGKPVIRLGSIRPKPQPHLASADDKPPAAP